MEAGTAHRALADESRRRIVDELRGAPSGLDVPHLAERLGLHQNTVRWHLGILRDADLVASSPAERTTPGRPRILYALSPRGDAAGRDDHRLLATILTGTLSEVEDGSERAATAGRAWGRYLIRRPLPLVRVDDEQAAGEVTTLLAEQGFAPEPAEGGIGMRRCPFHELAETNPDVVCAVHRGLIDGALEELGSDLRVEELDVFVRPDLCVARLARRQH
jgi:predicted ArsR family transcriptional regulator